MESSGRADFRTVPGFDNGPRFVGVIEQNKISDSYENYCILPSIQNGLQCQPTIFPPLTLESPLYEREYITMRYIKTLISLSITVQKETYLQGVPKKITPFFGGL